MRWPGHSQPAPAGRFRKKRIHCLEISSLWSSKLFITLGLVQGTPTPRQEELLGNKISPAAWLCLCLSLSSQNLKGVNLWVEHLEDSPLSSVCVMRHQSGHQARDVYWKLILNQMACWYFVRILPFQICWHWVASRPPTEKTKTVWESTSLALSM